ncbi:unnamed protein product [Blepharisma stoltei]|uniref:NADH dehydrogenase subunit 6 n=1 Tax=Blepharisma stoltei TaxID=1481888 RepID=A0AAU9JPA7_9CILI|nr:unnamed protein product [Blepharisma stoltei]
MDYSNFLDEFEIDPYVNAVIFESGLLVLLGIVITISMSFFNIAYSLPISFYIFAFGFTGILGILNVCRPKKFFTYTHIAAVTILIFMNILLVSGSSFYTILGYYYLLNLNCEPTFNGECIWDDNISDYIEKTFGSVFAASLILTSICMVSLHHAKTLKEKIESIKLNSRLLPSDQ